VFWVLVTVILLTAAVAAYAAVVGYEEAAQTLREVEDRWQF
jgi:hypothetical protein